MTQIEFDQWLNTTHRRPLVMGVVNVTPDSFSDGGRYSTPEAALAAAGAMIDAGADILDIGGESTRPGSSPVLAEEQIRRVVPVLSGLRNRNSVISSIDTTLSDVAEAALDAGAYIVNDVSAGRDDPAMLPLVARRRVPIILMHMLVRPKTMQVAPSYEDVVAEVSGFLQEQIINAGIHGIKVERILLDPGIGFGKTTAHNLELIRRLVEITTLGLPIVMGTSRKRFIGEITKVDAPAERLFGTAATVCLSVTNGARILRVHDVAEMKQVVDMTWAVMDS